jgi:hypothetical protein
MNKVLIAGFTLAALTAALPGHAQPTPTPGGSMAPAAAPAAAGMPALHHLVYEFGYNQKAASSGNNTGTTTIDIVGLASDGGLNVKATDNWWMAIHPKQSSNCEVYPNGDVTCSQAPYNLTGIQVSILPYLGRKVFSSLSTGLHSTWKQSYKVRASFAPSVSRGFGGQVYTWNCEFTFHGKGTMPEQPPLVLVNGDGSLMQQGGPFTKLNQQANIVLDPRLKIPVLVSNLSRFVPQQSTSSYSVNLQLIKYK